MPEAISELRLLALSGGAAAKPVIVDEAGGAGGIGTWGAGGGW